MKYDLDSVVYYLINGKLHSASILSRMQVENLKDGWNATDQQKNLFQAFGSSGVFYATCHGVMGEGEVFPSKEQLYRHLIGISE